MKRSERRSNKTLMVWSPLTIVDGSNAIPRLGTEYVHRTAGLLRGGYLLVSATKRLYHRPATGRAGQRDLERVARFRETMHFQQEFTEEFIRRFVNRWRSEFNGHSMFLCGDPLQLSDSNLALPLSSSEQRPQLFGEDSQALVPPRISVSLLFPSDCGALASAFRAGHSFARDGEIAPPNRRQRIRIIKGQLGHWIVPGRQSRSDNLVVPKLRVDYEVGAHVSV